MLKGGIDRLEIGEVVRFDRSKEEDTDRGPSQRKVTHQWQLLGHGCKGTREHY